MKKCIDCQGTGLENENKVCQTCQGFGVIEGYEETEEQIIDGEKVFVATTDKQLKLIAKNKRKI